MKPIQLLNIFAVSMIIAIAVIIACDSEPPQPSRENTTAFLNNLRSYDYSSDEFAGHADFMLRRLVQWEQYLVERDSLLTREQHRDYCRQLSLARAGWQVRAMTKTVIVAGPTGSYQEVAWAYVHARQYGSSAADIVAQSRVAPVAILKSMEKYIESFQIKRIIRVTSNNSNNAFLDFKDAVAEIVAEQEAFILTGGSKEKLLEPFVPQIACCSGTVQAVARIQALSF